MSDRKVVLVTGAGGFIGGHLCAHLMDMGHWVIGVDIKFPEFRNATEFTHDFHRLDLTTDQSRDRLEGILVEHAVQWVFALAADMGGMGFISFNDAQILQHNLRINLQTIAAANNADVERYLFTSSACVYPEYRQMDDDTIPNLTESDAYPADPQDEYGWEKLTSERLCRSFMDDYGLETRVVRFHNTYGSYGTWRGGREKAPAALMRKVAFAKLTGGKEVKVWGDGKAIRSYTHVSDTVKGLEKLMRSDRRDPLNMGTDVPTSVLDIVATAAEVADYHDFEIVHVPGPMGVRNRNSDNTTIREVLGWEPQLSLYDGFRRTYPWIEDQVRQALENGWTEADEE